MRVGIIDLGTNSIRFDVHEISGKGRTTKQKLNQVTRLHREKIMVRLGEGVFKTGKLNPKAIQRANFAIQSFQKTASQLKVDRLVAFGTSALRDASNAALFINRVKERFGLEMKMISGEEEARLIAQGVLAGEPKLPKKSVLIDIGGGSTEVSWVKDREIVQAFSLPLGTARLMQHFFDHESSESALKNCRNGIREILKQFQVPRSVPGFQVTVASSGTARALEKLINRSPFLPKQLNQVLDTLAPLTREELLKVRGMEEKRVDMIVPGALLLSELVRWTGSTEVRVTDQSLRDGILVEELSILDYPKESSLAFHLESILEKSIPFGVSEKEIQGDLKLGEELFRNFSKVTSIGEKWGTFLKAALILRNSGVSVSLVNYEKHSEYIARHLDLPTLESSDQEWIALLCRYHRDEADLPPSLSSNVDFCRTLALVRLVDTLMDSPYPGYPVESVSVKAKKLTVKLSERTVSEVELFRLSKQTKSLKKLLRGQFESTFPFIIFSTR